MGLVNPREPGAGAPPVLRRGVSVPERVRGGVRGLPRLLSPLLLLLLFLLLLMLRLMMLLDGPPSVRRGLGLPRLRLAAGGGGGRRPRRDPRLPPADLCPSDAWVNALRIIDD